MESRAGTSAPGATHHQAINWSDILDMTNHFSDEIGRGGFGVVYKGKLPNGEEIAVKKLNNYVDELNNVQFENELNTLMSVQHQNIVRLVCYCNESTASSSSGQEVWTIKRALCLQYMQKGSLENHITDESDGLDWHSRYGIIKGICEGLNYLHTRGIIHMDIKPGNILLDDNMVPKITDFGSSKLVSPQQTTQITKHFLGTRGYMPPEFVDSQRYSEVFDVFSLGVLITEIMIGRENRIKYSDETSPLVIRQVCKNWEKRLKATQNFKEDIQKVKACITMALRCMNTERRERPTVERVIDTLNYMDTIERTSIVAQLLTFGPEGGQGGWLHKMHVAPYHLQEIRIRHGAVIDSLAFSYKDFYGFPREDGPWGGYTWDEEKVELEPFEFLTEVYGTKGEYPGLQDHIITSLTFVTNFRRCGPYGKNNGDHFQLKAPNKSCIVGFFARSGTYLDAIGVYTRPI